MSLGYFYPNLQNLHIAPDVVDYLPHQLAQVSYGDGVQVYGGNVLAPRLVNHMPTVKWDADPNAYYTLCMTDIDHLRQHPRQRYYNNWLIGNIPGNNIAKGEVLVDYVGSGPLQGTGLHRYVFLVYKQPQRLVFTDRRIPSTTGIGRPNLGIRSFAQRYNLGQPIAYNVYQSEWDNYVPQLYAKLGL